MRRALFLLAAVNPENWLQVKVLDNTFNILNFRSMDPGVKSKTFYIVRRCASIWRGPGFFWSCSCGERVKLKLGFCRSVFIK